MKKRKIIALTLLVAFLCSLCIPGTWAIAEDGDNTPPATENEGMEISKTATPNEDGTYTITLEAYATGEKISTEVTKDVPTDIILVLDQSGSMNEDMNTYDFRPYTNKSNNDYYNLRHNGGDSNLYYQLEDGGYATVAVTVQYNGLECTAIEKGLNNDNQDMWGSSYTNYWQNRNNLYAKIGGEYQKVTVERSGQIIYTYTYTLPDKTVIATSSYDRSKPTFSGVDGGALYLASAIDETQNVYTYTYTDKDGAVQIIGSSIGAGTRPTDFILYERYVTSSVSRLQALKNAVRNFSNAVAQKAAGKDGVLGTDDDVDHRIAVVGFSCSNTGNDNSYNDYQNTELFIGATQYRYNARNNGAASQYGNAFQSMKTTDGQNNIIASIGALAADGATYVNHGMEMANGILDGNPVPAGEKRNRVVIVFTDGAPGYSDYESDVANSAIREANGTRDKGANVYSVGIFNGADATSAGEWDGNGTEKANWFMQNLSDNKGTPQTPSYYLSASDADTLNNIFQQISDNIESGGSGTTLGSEAVIRDVISPAFNMPENAQDIKVYTAESDGSTNKWKERVLFTGTVDVDPETSTVSVRGFSFKDNWCGSDTTNGQTTFHDGQKLIIEFNVVPKDGFLGGNGVYTNTSAGVYENAEAENPLFTFDRPQVDVPIKDITVKAEDKNVYLLGALTAEQIKSGATAKVGEVTLDLTKADQNYGLATWQHEYVDIAVAYADKEGKVVIDLNDLTDDTTYTVTVKVVPKYEGEIKEKTGSAEGKINVFKPVLTFKDGEVYYGADVPDNDTLNKESFVPGATVWKHNETNADSVTMIGTAPANTEFAMTYTVEPGKIENGKINSKTVDIPVDVANVKIGNVDVTNHTTFQHIDCDGKTCTVPTGKEFLLHPKTCTLTITKQGGDSNEPYVFDIMKNGQKYSEVTIVGNHSETIVELPVGIYTIREATGWSWRYNPAYSNNVVLSKDHASGTLTCTNQIKETKWLNGYSTVVKNIFGVSHNN